MICQRCKKTTYPLKSVKLDTETMKAKKNEKHWHGKIICSCCYYDVQELKIHVRQGGDSQ